MVIFLLRLCLSLNCSQPLDLKSIKRTLSPPPPKSTAVLLGNTLYLVQILCFGYKMLLPIRPDESFFCVKIPPTYPLFCPQFFRWHPRNSVLNTVGYTMRDIRYKWNEGPNSVGVSNEVSLPQFKVLGHRQKDLEISLTTGNDHPDNVLFPCFYSILLTRLDITLC